MRKIIGMLGCAVLLAGCASHKSPAPKPDQPKAVPAKAVITPDLRPVGKVAKVNQDGRFVVLSYAPGQVPQPEAHLNIYHHGLKVAEVKVDAKWQTDNNAVADILVGEVQVGDEARQD